MCWFDRCHWCHPEEFKAERRIKLIWSTAFVTYDVILTILKDPEYFSKYLIDLKHNSYTALRYLRSYYCFVWLRNFLKFCLKSCLLWLKIFNVGSYQIKANRWSSHQLRIKICTKCNYPFGRNINFHIYILVHGLMICYDFKITWDIPCEILYFLRISCKRIR